MNMTPKPFTSLGTQALIILNRLRIERQLREYASDEIEDAHQNDRQERATDGKDDRGSVAVGLG